MAQFPEEGLNAMFCETDTVGKRRLESLCKRDINVCYVSASAEATRGYQTQQQEAATNQAQLESRPFGLPFGSTKLANVEGVFGRARLDVSFGTSHAVVVS